VQNQNKKNFFLLLIKTHTKMKVEEIKLAFETNVQFSLISEVNSLNSEIKARVQEANVIDKDLQKKKQEYDKVFSILKNDGKLFNSRVQDLREASKQFGFEIPNNSDLSKTLIDVSKLGAI
jgi:uncharacterized protein YoxC